MAEIIDGQHKLQKVFVVLRGMSSGSSLERSNHFTGKRLAFLKHSLDKHVRILSFGKVVHFHAAEHSIPIQIQINILAYA